MDTVTVIAVPAVIIGIPLIIWVVSALGIFTINEETEDKEWGKHERKW
jgi:hypothetical protein